MKHGLRHIIYVSAAIVLMTIAYSCNTTGCLENRSSIPLAGFYSYQTGSAIRIDSLTITGIGVASGEALNDPRTPISTIYLPMRSTMDNVSWELACRVAVNINDSTRISFTVADTLTLHYTSEPYFASDECGVIYKYHIDQMSYTKHLIDSVAITDSLISNVDMERIKIFYPTE